MIRPREDGARSPHRSGGLVPVIALLVLPTGAVVSCLAGVASLHVPGPVSRPVADRWAEKSTPLTGGFGLLVGFVLALVVSAHGGQFDTRLRDVALAGTAAFVLGLLRTQTFRPTAEAPKGSIRQVGRCNLTC